MSFFTTQLTSGIGRSILRANHVRALAEFVVEETPKCAHPLVTGDFNAEPNSEEIRLLGGDKTAPPMPGLALHDAWRYAEPAAPGCTWDRRNPALFATGEPDARIDYVFLGYRLEHERAPRVRSARLAGNGPIDDVWPSDHAL